MPVSDFLTNADFVRVYFLLVFYNPCFRNVRAMEVRDMTVDAFRPAVVRVQLIIRYEQIFGTWQITLLFLIGVILNALDIGFTNSEVYYSYFEPTVKYPYYKLTCSLDLQEHKHSEVARFHVDVPKIKGQTYIFGKFRNGFLEIQKVPYRPFSTFSLAIPNTNLLSSSVHTILDTNLLVLWNLSNLGFHTILSLPQAYWFALAILNAQRKVLLHVYNIFNESHSYSCV